MPVEKRKCYLNNMSSMPSTNYEKFFIRINSDAPLTCNVVFAICCWPYHRTE